MPLRMTRSGAPCAPLRIVFGLLVLAACPAADPAPAAPADGTTPGEAWHQAADRLALAQDPQWSALLHYAPSLLGERSVVDEPAFFLAPDGKRNAQAELHADLSALLDPVPSSPPFIARFPARAAWLCERLGIPRSALPVPRADECEEAIAHLKARGATLVFASGYLSTPASMFGHTLLLVRNRFDSLALAQAVNYAAATDTTNGLVFAVRGIFGGYDGYFSLLPYYQKISEYTDLDQRDLWEYDLDLDDAELRRLLLHIWELRHIGSSYYFFDENCSYRLLFLLDAARPSLELRRKTGLWVIPLDTVKLVRQSGIVTTVRHRPSRMTRVRAQAAALGDRKAVVLALAEGEIAPEEVTGDDADRILDTAAEYLNSRLSKGRMGLEEYQARLVRILKRRAALGIKREPVPIPRPSAPDAGHPSGRIALAAGRDGDRTYGELGLRPAYHDLLDPPTGFTPGSAIDFTHVVLRWYAGERVELQRFDAVSLVSLSPVDNLYRPKSFTISGGLIREPEADGAGWRRRAYLAGGSGYALELPTGLAYALVEGNLRIGVDNPHVVLGLGPTIGVVLSPVKRWQIHVHAAAHPGIIGEQVGHGEATVGQRLHWDNRWSIGLDTGWKREWGVDGAQVALGVRAYF